MVFNPFHSFRKKTALAANKPRRPAPVRLEQAEPPPVFRFSTPLGLVRSRPMAFPEELPPT